MSEFTEDKSEVTITKIKDIRERNPMPISTKTAFLSLVTIFIIALTCLYTVYLNFPELSNDEKQHIKLPRNMHDAKNLGIVLSAYREHFFYTVLTGFLVTYIFLQTFAIPGSIFLSILSGFLFPFWLALFLVCLCSAVGASLCYLLSYCFGRPLIHKFWPQRITDWSNEVAKHKDNMTFYIIFLRITPLCPNWFINVASPLIEVPLAPFFFGTLVGVATPSFIAIEAGKTLNELTSSKDVLSWNSVILLLVFSLLSLLPIIFKKQLRGTI